MRNVLIPWILVVQASGGCGESVVAIERGSEPFLSYTLGGPIGLESCRGDGDGDCLDDARELELAALVSPILFLDDGESCADSGDLGVRPSFQVRPIATEGGAVEAWAASPDRTAPRVQITYYLNWPLDCGHRTEHFHLGDSEHVRYLLASEDLVTWSIVEATYHAHGRANVLDGVRLDDLADAIGSEKASVAVEGDKHGSWFGRRMGSDDCGGSEDDFGLGAIDCFAEGGWRRAFEDGAYLELELDGSQNIGEPPLGDGGRFLDGAVIEERDGETTRFRTSEPRRRNGRIDLVGTEYWWNAPRGFQTFCGWVCPDAERTPDGRCERTRFPILGGEWKDFDAVLDGVDLARCGGALEGKVDVTPSVFRAMGGAAT